MSARFFALLVQEHSSGWLGGTACLVFVFTSCSVEKSQLKTVPTSTSVFLASYMDELVNLVIQGKKKNINLLAHSIA